MYIHSAKPKQVIRADLIGTHQCHCPAAGLYTCADAPILEMCRRLVAAGANPEARLDCYRGGILALTVRSVGEGARLKINGKGTGFAWVSTVGKGAPVRRMQQSLILPTPATEHDSGRAHR
jgi:hypothetical protein